MRAKDGTIRYARIAAEGASWVTRLTVVAFALVAAIGLFLLQRRIVGVLSDPLPVFQLMVTATLVAAVAFLWCDRNENSNASLALAGALIIVFAVACSYPGNRIVDWIIWLATGGAAFAMLISQRVRPAEIPNPASIRVADVTELEVDIDAETVLQNITRVRTAEGHDAIRGTLFAEFEPGSKQATVHIAFCPPFERLPEVEANVVDDSDADVKLTQVFHHGTQLEIRLPEVAPDELSVEVEFFAIDAEAE